MIADDEYVQIMASEIVKVPGWTSWHIDEICGDFLYQGRSLRYWAHDFFEKFNQSIRSAGELRTLVLIVPISTSLKLSLRSPQYDQTCTFLDTVPTIYLIEERSIFLDAFEEYRIVLDGLSPKLGSSIFRSWRDRRSKENGWEFSNDVYLWQEGPLSF